jgi:hypothetical protein
MSRIYQGGKAENKYQQVDKSRGFAPVAASSSQRQMQGYSNAIAMDAQTMGKELTRQQAAENLELQAKQNAAASAQKVSQGRESAELKMAQSQETGTFSLMKLNEELNMKLASQGKEAQDQVANARTKLVSNTFNSLLSFGGSVVTYGEARGKALEQAELEAQKEAQFNDQMSSFIGGVDGSVSISDSTTELSAGVDEVTTANAKARLGVSDGLITSDDPAEVEAGLRMGNSTIFNQLAPVRGRMYAARAQYPAVLQQAVDAGLIRPTAQGGAQDLQRFNKSFLEASGLLGPGIDRKQLAEIVIVPALGASANTMLSIDTNHRNAVIKTNAIEAKSRIASLALGSNTSSVIADFEAAQLETAQTQMGFMNGGKVNAQTTAYTVAEFLGNLKAENKLEAIDALAGHPANPATPNITLGQKYAALFQEARKGALSGRIQRNDTYELEQKFKGSQLQQEYLRDPTNVDKRDEYLAFLERPGASAEDIKSANNLRNPTVEVNSEQLSAQWSQGERAGILLSEEELAEAELRGLDSKTAKYWRSRTREAILKETVDPATTGLLSTIKKDIATTAGFKGQLDDQATSELQNRALAAQNKIVDIVSQRVLGDESLRTDSARLQTLVDGITKQVTSEPEFTATYDDNSGKFNFAGPLLNTTVQKVDGKEDFSFFSAKDLFGPRGGIPQIQINPLEDRMVLKNDLIRDADLMLAGKGDEVSQRTKDIAASLKLSTRDFLDAQLQVAGFGNLGQRARFNATQDTYAPGNIPEGMEAPPSRAELQELYPQSSVGDVAPPNTVAGNGKQRTIQVGRQLLDDGYVIWQHPNFDVDRGYVQEGGARVGQHATNSAHYHGEALDLPASHNSAAKLDALARRLRANMEGYGVTQVFWGPGHDTHMHITFAP